jgi:hypothetical protein
MKMELIQQIILDSHKQPLPKLSKRDLELIFIPGMALGVVGSRRCGKTYRTYQFIDEMRSKRENVCRIQFNDHRLSRVKSSELHIIDDAYYAIFPEKRYKEDVVFIFDEIHRIDGWEDYILYLLESVNHKVMISGSSSKLAKGKYASQLRGKLMPSVMYPFSFKEFLRYSKTEIDFVSGSGKSFLISALNIYLEQGGFPGLLDIPKEHHRDLLKTYWDTMLLRDIIEAHPKENINSLLLRQFACSLAARNSCAMTISKLAVNLSEMGFQFSNETLYRYLDHLNEAYIFDAVEFFSPSEKVKNRNYRKVYCVDWALAASVAFGDHQRKSRYFENMVYLELKRRKKEVSYYRTREGFEIDFVVSDNNFHSIEFVQVAYSMEDEEVRKREIRAIEKSAGYLKVDKATIVTFNESDELRLPGVKINIVPAWRWLLGE